MKEFIAIKYCIHNLSISTALLAQLFDLLSAVQLNNTDNIDNGVESLRTFNNIFCIS
jgi:hypothetical protein